MKSFELHSGDAMPLLGLGTWKMEDDVAAEAVQTALSVGFRHIDGAWIYQNEKGVGQGLHNAFKAGLASRDQVWVTSKLWNDKHQPEHVESAIKETLSDLQLDHLDLYLIHWPVAHQHQVVRPEDASGFQSLAEVPLASTWQAMLQLVDKGLCKNVGVSNFSVKKLKALKDETGVHPAVNQVESHPLLQQPELKAYCDSNGILLTAYSPLGSGDRPDNMKKAEEPSLFELEPIKQIADEHGVTPAQVMIGWAINRGTAVIPKSASRGHQEENFAAASIDLSAAQLEAIAALDQGYRFVDGTFWEIDGGPYTVANLWDE